MPVKEIINDGAKGANYINAAISTLTLIICCLN